jgi:hypothetical protein
MRRAGPALVTLIALASPAAAEPPASTSTSPSTSPSPSPSGPAAAPAPDTVSEARVRDLVDDWVAAQNDGDLAALKGLYAQRVEGIRRVGAQTWRLDRKAWLADRGKLLRRRIDVDIDDVRITTGTASARVELTQTVTAGKQREASRKRLVLVVERGALRIAREEPIADGPVVGPSHGAVSLVMSLYDEPYLFVRADADPAWGRGPLRQPELSGTGDDGAPTFVAFRGAGGLPAALASWKGRNLRLYDVDGVSCSGSVTALELAAGGTPGDADMVTWYGSYQKSPPWPDDRRAAAVFAMMKPYLVAKLKVEKGCQPVVAVDGAAPSIFAEDSDQTLEAAAAAQFKALPEYQRLQKSFAVEYRRKGAWAEPIVTVYTGAKRRYVSVKAGHPAAECGDFEASLWAFYEVEGDALRLRNDPAGPYAPPAFVLDTDRDGKAEIVSDASYLIPTGDGYQVAARLRFPFNACGC